MKYDRHWKMKQLFLQKKSLTNKELCDAFSISVETVRRDLAFLEKEGVIRRVYGGAILTYDNIMPESMQEWNTRVTQHLRQKQQIAAELLHCIPDNSTIALDSGTSILEVAKLLHQKKNLSILTNSIHIAVELSSNTGHMVYFIGGMIKKNEMITAGFLSLDFLEYFSHIDLAIVSADGFSVAKGISDHSVEMGTLKAAMVEKADRVFAVMDSSKFASTAFYRVCGIDKLNLVATDAGAPAQMLEALRSTGIEVLVAKP